MSRYAFHRGSSSKSRRTNGTVIHTTRINEFYSALQKHLLNNRDAYPEHENVRPRYAEDPISQMASFYSWQTFATRYGASLSVELYAPVNFNIPQRDTTLLEAIRQRGLWESSVDTGESRKGRTKTYRVQLATIEVDMRPQRDEIHYLISEALSDATQGRIIIAKRPLD